MAGGWRGGHTGGWSRKRTRVGREPTRTRGGAGGGRGVRARCAVAPPHQSSPEPALQQASECWAPRASGASPAFRRGRSWRPLPGPGSVSLRVYRPPSPSHRILWSTSCPGARSRPASLLRPQPPSAWTLQEPAHSPACRPPASAPLSAAAALGGESESVYVSQVDSVSRVQLS